MHLKEMTHRLGRKHRADIRLWVNQIADDETSAAQIFARCMDGTYTMSLPYDGDRFVGMVIWYVNGDTLHFVGAGGNVMKEWEGLHNSFVELALSNMCNSYQFRGRRGFLRAFKEYGMTEKYTVMECKF